MNTETTHAGEQDNLGSPAVVSSDLPPLPEVDTASMAWDGRSVDYINGYENGFESAQEKMQDYALLAVAQERERNAKLCDAIYIEEQGEPVCYGFAKECAAAIRAQGKATPAL